MQLARRSLAQRAAAAKPAAPALRRRRSVAARAGGLDTNIFVNLFASGACGAAAAAVTLLTAEDTDAELKRLQTPAGALPLAAGVAADAVAHSIPGLNVLLALLSEPAGAAAGVAYLFTIILSSPAVDPTNLAPKGTVVNAEKAADSRGNVRVPFSQIIPTALKVIDPSNSGSSGAGWTTGPDGLPKLPITSVAVVLGVGSVILEAASHAPVFSLFMPRVLQVAGWLAVAGYLLDKREASSSSA
jgi:hypothetical protein